VGIVPLPAGREWCKRDAYSVLGNSSTGTLDFADGLSALRRKVFCHCTAGLALFVIFCGSSNAGPSMQHKFRSGLILSSGIEQRPL
jgi:hypothetical protein